MQKALTSWKTTLGGLLSLVGATVIAVWPEYTKLGTFIGLLATGLVGLAARDNGVTSEQAGAKPSGPSVELK